MYCPSSYISLLLQSVLTVSKKLLLVHSKRVVLSRFDIRIPRRALRCVNLSMQGPRDFTKRLADCPCHSPVQGSRSSHERDLKLDTCWVSRGLSGLSERRRGTSPAHPCLGRGASAAAARTLLSPDHRNASEVTSSHGRVGKIWKRFPT